ncbi:MAG: PIN domain-containing protein [Acidobacteria bacterium]|nr:MAG: PIN domain-containing protein [Acidobacteriota bacterium]
MTSCVDASFLFSLYVLDANSARASAKMKRADLPLLLTEVGKIEILNAVGLRLFRKELQPAEAKKVYALFRQDIEQGVVQIVPLPSAAYQQAERIARTHTPLLGTRTLDVLHVAGALVLKADAFYTFDQKLASLATAIGLTIP